MLVKTCRALGNVTPQCIRAGSSGRLTCGGALSLSRARRAVRRSMHACQRLLGTLESLHSVRTISVHISIDETDDKSNNNYEWASMMITIER